jgi:trans-2,3-dihydro-3-hydroxyanthranilate isomerase
VTRSAFRTVDVFTARGFAGNPLAVFTRADGLTDRQMLLLAREFGYSETTFVLPPVHPDHHARLKIFNPTGELPFAGHPTVGTAAVIATERGLVDTPGSAVELLLEEAAGVVPVLVRRTPGGPVHAELTAPVLPVAGPKAPALDVLADMLALTEADLFDDTGVHQPEAYSAGVPFLYVPINSLAAVERIRFDASVWQTALSDYWAPQVYTFSRQTRTAGATLHARMFSPAFGVTEDAGTGAAAVAVAGYLAKREPGTTGTIGYVIEQGLELGRPSRLHGFADLAAGEVRAVRVGGSVVPISSGEMRVPQDEQQAVTR